jgi:hypothetical protein
VTETSRPVRCYINMGRAALACLGAAAMMSLSGPALAGATTPPPRAELGGVTCHQSSDSLNRWMVVTATMRPLSGTQRMAMRFQLLRKRGGRFVEVTSGDLGKWVHPTNPPTLGQRPGDHWSVQKQVVNLSAPAIYRLRVTFRWTGVSSRVLGTAVKLSNLCDER